MANKAISELPQAQNVNNQDLFVLEQSGIAKKLTAETFITEQGIIDALAEALDGHGGISSVTLSSVSGRIRTYRITFTDQSATTFQVYDGTSIDRISRTSSSGLDDVYTIFLSDGTTTFFTVHNGADGTVSETMLNDALKDKAPAITETTESSAIATFSDGADNLVMHNVIAEINPVQSGSGDPSPDNIRPISGWTGCNVTRTGKNLLPNEAVSGSGLGITWVKNADGSITINGTATGNRNIAIYGSSDQDLKPFPYSDKPITLSGCPSGGGTSSFRLGGFLYKDGVYTGRAFINTGGTTTVSGVDFNQIYFVIFVYSGYTFNNVTFYPMVELGSTATDYEPYITPSTASLSWQTEAGTVYGGTIDVATGLLTVDRAMVDLGTLTWNYNASSGHERFVSQSSLSGAKTAGGSIIPNAISSQFAVTSSNGVYAHIKDNTFSVTGEGRAEIYASAYTDATSFKTAVTGQTICYELATPQTYQLTGQQLKTLLGTNNVWADTGNVSATYPADTKMFIEKLTMPTEDDLVANQAITSGKYFMIGNSLYLALANIASGAAITIGTNAQRVSLADALNTINS